MLRLIAFILLPAVCAFARSAGFISKESYWWKNINGKKISVCWENDGTYVQEKLLVKEAVERSWEDYSPMDFDFRGACDINEIRNDRDGQWIGIKIRNESPNTLGVGNQLNIRDAYLKEMDYMLVTLNFNMINWPGASFGYASKTQAQKDLMKDNLIRMQAIHEFGHVLGITHEHLRAEVPSDCVDFIKNHVKTDAENDQTEKSFSRPIHFYDSYSIMNYCGILRNPTPLPKLSCGDVAAVRAMYGTKNAQYALCCTPDRIEQAFEGTPTYAENVYLLQNCTNGRENINSTVPTVQTPDKPNSQVVIPDPQVNELPPQGWPIFMAEFVSGGVTTKVPVEWKVEVKNKVFGSTTYPGFEISLKSLMSNFMAMPAPALKNSTDFFDFNNIQWKKADILLYSYGTPDPIAPFSLYPQYVNNAYNFTYPVYNYDSSPGFTFTAPNFVSGGVATIWIPKGYGTFDSVAKEFITSTSVIPKGSAWFYSDNPNQRYRVDNSYNQLSFRIQRRYSGNTSDAGIYSKNRLVIDLPTQSDAPVRFMTLFGKHLIKQVYVPPGTAPDGKKVGPLWMDESEVTQLGYQALAGKSPFTFPLGPDHPVESVSFYDAILYANKRSQIEGYEPVYSYTQASYSSDGTYCTGLANLQTDIKKNGYRLPMLHEWQYAYLARFPSVVYWPNYSDPQSSLPYAWIMYNSPSCATRPVKQKIPNNWNLFDMAGNVMEWTWKAEGGNTSHYLIGGYWSSIYSDLQYSAALAEGPHVKRGNAGFRLVRRGPSIVPALQLLLQ